MRSCHHIRGVYVQIHQNPKFSFLSICCRAPIHIQILQPRTFLLRYDTSEAIPPAVKDLFTNVRRRCRKIFTAVRRKNAFLHPMDYACSPCLIQSLHLCPTSHPTKRPCKCPSTHASQCSFLVPLDSIETQCTKQGRREKASFTQVTYKRFPVLSTIYPLAKHALLHDPLEDRNIQHHHVCNHL